MLRALLCFFLFCGGAEAQIIQTARGPIEINDGDVICPPDIFGPDAPACTVNFRFTKWNGTIENLHDVTFVMGRFNRKVPHSVVFVNCSNLTFIDSSLTNVELQDDFTIRSSLTIHKWEEQVGNRNKQQGDHRGQSGDNARGGCLQVLQCLAEQRVGRQRVEAEVGNSQQR